MRQISLVEYATTVGVELGASELDAIRRLVPSLSVAPTAGAPGRFDLTPSSFVGVLRAGDTVVQIGPKIPIDRVVFMIWYTADPSDWERQAGVVGHAPSLHEAAAWAFTRAADAAVRAGLLRGYRTEEDSIPGVRGRILMDRQMRTRFGIAPPVEVCYDDFTEDIPENRVLRAAVLALEKLPILVRATRNGLRRLDGLLSGVRAVEYDPRSLPRFHWNRLNQHYRPAVELALVILRACSFELHSGDLAVAGFLFDMNKVFERFVHRALREALKLTEDEFPRGRHCGTLDEVGRVGLEPDLSWWRRRRCVFVGDCKYKRLREGRGERDDLFQLLAYLISTGLPGGLLVYGEAGPAVEHRVTHLRRSLIVTGIDLRGTPADILRATAGVARQVEAWAGLGAAALAPV